MLQIRAATHHDVTNLASLLARDGAWVRYIIRKRRHNHLQMLVALADEQPVGFMTYIVQQIGCTERNSRHNTIWNRWFQQVAAADPRSLLLKMQIASIQEFCCIPDKHRSQNASALLQEFTQMLGKHGLDALEVRLNAGDERAQQQYQEVGFQQTQLLVQRPLTSDDATFLQQSPTTTRRATGADIPQLAALVRQEVRCQQKFAGFLQLVPEIHWLRYVDAKLHHRDRPMLVLEQDGQLLGYVELRMLSPGDRFLIGPLWSLARYLRWRFTFAHGVRTIPQRIGVIEDIYLLPTCRKVGYGAMLLQASLAWFQQRQAVSVHASIWRSNTISLQFFQKHGFSVKEQIMRKELQATKAQRKEFR